MSLIRIRCNHPLRGIVWIAEELRDYTAPLDLPPQAIGGSRAVDSPLVRHTGDRLPTEYGYTATGNLHDISPEDLETQYFRLKGLLQYADQVWRGQKYLNIAFGLIGAGDPLPGECVVPAPIVCAVKELRWYDADGRPLE